MKHLSFLLILSILCLSTLIAQEDFWEQTSGPPGKYRGGHMPAAMNSLGDIFCTSFSGCVYRSTDGGLKWEELRNGLPNIEYGSITINKNNHIFCYLRNRLVIFFAT